MPTLAMHGCRYALCRLLHLRRLITNACVHDAPAALEVRAVAVVRVEARQPEAPQTFPELVHDAAAVLDRRGGSTSKSRQGKGVRLRAADGWE